MSLQICALHKEQIFFYVLQKCTCSLLLGLLWLQNHAKVIDWSSEDVSRGVNYASKLAFLLLSLFLPFLPFLLSSAIPGLPKQYSEYADVYSIKQVETWLPHRPYNCSIDLLHGAAPTGAEYTQSRMYSLCFPGH